MTPRTLPAAILLVFGGAMVAAFVSQRTNDHFFGMILCAPARLIGVNEPKTSARVIRRK